MASYATASHTSLIFSEAITIKFKTLSLLTIATSFNIARIFLCWIWSNSILSFFISGFGLRYFLDCFYSFLLFYIAGRRVKLTIKSLKSTSLNVVIRRFIFINLFLSSKTAIVLIIICPWYNFSYWLHSLINLIYIGTFQVVSGWSLDKLNVGRRIAEVGGGQMAVKYWNKRG